MEPAVENIAFSILLSLITLNSYYQPVTQNCRFIDCEFNQMQPKVRPRPPSIVAPASCAYKAKPTIVVGAPVRQYKLGRFSSDSKVHELSV